MSIRKNHVLRKWILGTAATSLLWHTFPNTSSAQGPLFPKKKTAANTRHNSGRPGAQTSAQAQAGQPTAAPRLLNQNNAQPSNSGGTSIQQISDNMGASGDKSEVQRKLEELYEQNGREMPDMQLNLQPIPTSQMTGQQSPQQFVPPPQQRPTQQPAPRLQQNSPAMPRSAQPIQAAGRFPQPSAGTQYPIVPQAGVQMPSQNKLRQASLLGYFKKLTNRNDKPLPTQAPLPPDISQNEIATNIPKIPVIQPNNYPSAQPSGYATVPQTQQSPPLGTVSFREPGSPTGRASISTSNQSDNQPSADLSQSVAVTDVDVQLPSPGPIASLPELSQEAVPIQSLVAVELPELQAEAQQLPSSGKSSPQRDRTETRTASSAVDSPASNSGEAEPVQDFRTASPTSKPSLLPRKAAGQAKSSDSIVISPRTKSLPKAAEVVQAPETDSQIVSDDSEPNQLATSDSEGSPFVADGKEFVETTEVVESGSAADPTAPSLATAPADEPRPVASNPGAATASSDEPAALDKRDFIPPSKTPKRDAEKMQKIHERMGMKGLKGFCPVTLREERELVDAKAEFSFIHRSQKFHFASAEARDTFVADPARYAPAAYGADVVALSRDKSVVEGTLDYAAWYKGKLYLFGTQENYHTFIDDPIPFATLDGIE